MSGKQFKPWSGAAEYCLFRHVCLNYYGKYGTLNKLNPSSDILKTLSSKPCSVFVNGDIG